MKSLNVKKIATAAAGAALLGAAFAGAVKVDEQGLGSFNFFAAGSPQVKIVVGANAAPSDAVAAANIAAMIGNMAYTSQEITVLGTDALSCSGGTTTPTSTPSTDDTVSLTVTTPGVNPNVAYQMKSFIGNDQLGGFLDSNVTDDRMDSMSGSNTILATTSPFASGGRKVTATETSLAFRGTIADPQSTKSYTEEEHYFFYAKSAYDTSSKKVKAKSPQLAYEAQFTNPIQECVELTPDDQICSDTYRTSKHRMKIKLFGADWLLVGMSGFPTDGTVNTSTTVELGKEIQYKEFMQIGDEVTAPSGIKVKLKDIGAVAQGAGSSLPASFEIYDKDGKLLDAQTLFQDGEYNKNNIVIRVFQVFAGLGQTSYAQVSIFSDKLTLQNGAVVNTDNQNWRVNLVGGGSSYGSSLARIQLNRQVIDDMVAGNSVAFLDKPQIMKFTYNGLADTTYDTISFSTGNRNFPVSSSDTSSKGSYVRVTSGLTSPFNFGASSVNSFYYVTGDSSKSVFGGMSEGNATLGTVFYQDSSTGNFVPYYNSAAVANVMYDAALAGWGTNESAATVRFWNYTAQVPAQCGTFGTLNGSSNASVTVTGLTLVNTTTAAAGTLGAQTTGLTPTTTGFILPASINVTVSATGVNAGCTSGNFVMQIPTGDLVVPAIGTKGVAANVTSNYVQYTYGSNSQNIRFASGGIGNGTTDVAGAYSIFVPEYQKDDDTTTGAFALDIGYGDQDTPRLAPASGTATGGYNSTYTTGSTTATAFEAGYISPRGSMLDSIGLSSAAIKYAITLAPALYTFSSASVDTTANTATNDFKAGDSALDSDGYKVVVGSITAKGTGGSSTSTGGTVSGVEGLKPSSDKAYVVKALDTSSSPLVVTDAQASSTEPLIVVGGPLVNSVAAQALASAPAATASMEPVVQVQGDKILVYGYSAADTQAAAAELIKYLGSNADSITGR